MGPSLCTSFSGDEPYCSLSLSFPPPLPLYPVYVGRLCRSQNYPEVKAQELSHSISNMCVCACVCEGRCSVRHPWQASLPVAHWSISDSCLGEAISAVLWLQTPCLQQAREYIKHCGVDLLLAEQQDSMSMVSQWHIVSLGHPWLSVRLNTHFSFPSLYNRGRHGTRGQWGDGESQVQWHWAQPATHPLQ